MSLEKITYNGADLHEWLQLADPSVVDMQTVISCIKHAGAGCDGAKQMAFRFCADIGYRYFGNEAYFYDDFDHMWECSAEPDDPRELAQEQIAAMKADILDMELSDNHALKIEEFVRERQLVITALQSWLDKPRTDEMNRLADKRPWPVNIAYTVKHGAANAALFLHKRPFPVISSDNILYSFEGGRYVANDDAIMAAEVRRTDPTNALDVDHVRKLVTGIHHKTSVSARPFQWIGNTADQPQDVVIFKNGLLDLDTGSLLPHDGQYFATGLPSHDFDPLAECPQFMKLLDQLDPSFHQTLQEWFGYCLAGDTSAHKFAVFVGIRRSGKSTLLRVLQNLVGTELSHSGMLADLGNDFGLEGCVGKRLLAIPDAHDVSGQGGARGKALERLKSIVGEDDVSINRKGVAIYATRLPIKITMVCNKMPTFIDESGALSSRMLIFNFEKSVEGHEDRALAKKLEAEMSGIANWALIGLGRLIQNGMQFTQGDAGRQAALDAAMSQSPAARFAEEHLEVTGATEDFVTMSEVYRAYRDFANDQGLRGGEFRSQSKLKDDLVAALPGIRYAQRRVDKKQTYGLIGIKSVSPADPFNL
jgi:P4 family phage/plasmid primase-like protien